MSLIIVQCRLKITIQCPFVWSCLAGYGAKLEEPHSPGPRDHGVVDEVVCVFHQLELPHNMRNTWGHGVVSFPGSRQGCDAI